LAEKSNHTLIIAEAGVNHNGDLSMAKQLIECAAKAGADYVKFQTFKAEKLVSKTARKAAYQISNTGEENSQFEMLKKLELDASTHHLLMEHCEKHHIQFLSTAFDLGSIDFLYELKIDLFKIPSGEITNLPYLRKIASLGKPIILSTGMSTLQEVEQALTILREGKNPDITVLHCNTEYPTPMEDVNLRAMNAMAKTFDVKVGYSDHTLGIEVPIAAVAMGAICIEKHFTLDRDLPGPDHRASLEPNELTEMIKGIRNIEKALGSEIKKPSPSERKNIFVARKSIHLKMDLPAGHILTEEDIEMKRPGDGISPMLIDQIIGKRLKKGVSKGTSLKMIDLD